MATRHAVLIILSAMLGGRAWGSSEVLRLELSRDFFDNAIPKPADYTTNVDEKLSDRVVKGSAFSASRLRIALEDCEDCIRLKSDVTVSTSTRTTTQLKPQPDIRVDVFSTGHTATTATKTMVLAADGITGEPLASDSRTALTLHGVAATAKGAFSGTKQKEAERIGQQAFFQGRARNEAEINRRVDARLHERLEGPEIAEGLRQFNHSYREVFYKPFFTESKVPRELHLSSRATGVAASVAGALPGDAKKAPAFDKGNAVSLRVHESFATDLLAAELGGTRRFDEEDLEEFLILHGINAGLGRYKPGDAQLALEFCEAGPIAVKFEPLQMQFALCVKSLELRGARAADLKINVAYVSRILAGGKLETWRLEEPELVGGPALKEEARAEIVKRLTRIFPEQLLMPKPELPASMAALGKLVVHRADLGEGWLTMEFWFGGGR